jgi:RNA polymerase sigma-70 factor (ECF subfamily)
MSVQRKRRRLERRHRDVVLLVDVDGFSYDEVAASLDIPVGTVRSRLYRARRQLQEALLSYAVDAGFASPSYTLPPENSGERRNA